MNDDIGAWNLVCGGVRYVYGADGSIEMDFTWMSGWEYDPDTRTLVRSTQRRCADGQVEAVREVIENVDPLDLP